MKIRSLQLKNIGVFEDETIAFPKNEEKGKQAEIHILTGQNGTGKTTILQGLSRAIDWIYSLKASTIAKSYSTYNNFYKRFTEDDSICKVTFQNGDVVNLSFQLIENRFNEDFDIIAFAYSGYRFIENEEDINIKEKVSYDPLENALEFNKTYEYDYTVNQWLANRMAQRNSAYFEGNNQDFERYNKSIEILKEIIFEIIEIPIEFRFKNEKLKVVAVKNGIELDFDLLPDGLRSIISWLGDLIMRMDALKWKDDLPLFEREFILFLDEIEVHLHPYWQRKILPVVQKLFTNAQIFITTHSPFIVNSIDGANIYELDLDEKGNSKVTKIKESSTADSYQNVIRSVFDINGQYGKPVQDKLDDFYKDRTKIMNGEAIDKKAFRNNINALLSLDDRSIKDKIHFELEQIGEEIEL